MGARLELRHMECDEPGCESEQSVFNNETPEELGWLAYWPDGRYHKGLWNARLRCPACREKHKREHEEWLKQPTGGPNAR